MIKFGVTIDEWNCEYPEPPYYPVIFFSQRTNGDKTANKMEGLAAQLEGFLDVARDSGFGEDSLEAIHKWKDHSAHQTAQASGKTVWHKNSPLRICKVERDHYLIWNN
ncbi:antibiotic biosynthesis monooxygenase family protein [Falsibacillus albus]|uniref:Antibiotic biosynthesis monooxygenase n=1 Tax=Falsibacillus albus TaxID=2478915 RepID=A0A3L7JRI8_9BACI|nr:antibiotic biosynthesis monooxygenase [Falsibacillus albus]RLQ93100.1 antibiotic biosynthesis monooxygenase [Falsibacillus albus]